ncbi:helix-turn-helix domain-containing protein [Dermatophilaceae bacterium Soc4.6]
MTASNPSTFEDATGEAAHLWSVQDLSRYLQIPVGTIYQWRHRGEGPPALRLGNHLRWEPDAVYRWVTSRR